MSQEEAKVRASRAARQAKHATRNGAAAAEAAADAITPDAETVRTTTNSLTAMATELGLGFLSLALAATAATYSVSRFKAAWALKP